MNNNNSDYNFLSNDDIFWYNDSINSSIDIIKSKPINDSLFINDSETSYISNLKDNFRIFFDNNSPNLKTKKEIIQEDLTEKEKLFKRQLYHIIKYHYDEDHYFSDGYEFLKKHIEKNRIYTMSWLQQFLVDNSNSPFIITAVLDLISLFDYSQMKAQGALIAVAMFNHKSFAVKEAVIKAFENWNDPECIKLIENLESEDRVFNSYIQEVIKEFKDHLYDFSSQN